MMIRFIAASFSLFNCVCLLNADEPSTKLRLINGTTLTGKILNKKIDFQVGSPKNVYGVLTINAEDLIGMVIAPRLSQTEKSDAARHLQELSDENYKIRENAQRKLIGFGDRAYWTVREFSNTEGLTQETLSRLKKIFGKLVKPENIAFSDVIRAKDFAGPGKFVSDVIEFEESILGKLTIQTCLIAEFNSRFQLRVSVDAGKYDQDHGMEVKFPAACGAFSIEASGTVDIYPPDAGDYIATPAGRMVGNKGNDNIAWKSGVGRLDSYVGGARMTVGESMKYSGNPVTSIILFINRNMWNPNIKSHGVYEVTITFE